MKKYSFKLKEKIIDLYQRFSSSYLAKKYKINQNTIKTWIFRHKLDNQKRKLNSFFKKEKAKNKEKYYILNNFLNFSVNFPPSFSKKK